MMDKHSLPNRAKVLISSDSVDAARAWSSVLHRYDIEVDVLGYDRFQNGGAPISQYHEVVLDHYGAADVALKVCETLRGRTAQPLLLCTYENDERFQLEAYRFGVEEYIKKPIGIPLFVAKVRAWLRQACQQADTPQMLTANNFWLDQETRMLSTTDTSVKLSYLECRLMVELMAHRGQVVEADALTQRVWSMYGDQGPQALKNLVYRLRHKIERISGTQECIESVPGIGYMLQRD